MRLKLIAVGTKMPAWVEQGFEEYKKRLPREWKFSCVELPLAKRIKTSSVAQLKTREGEQMMHRISPSDYVVALDVLGKHVTTPELSDRLIQWQMIGRDVVMLIGGPDGLDDVCLDRADEKMSLSKLTLPHPLVRVVLSEQLYRAWTITQNHPYHK